MDGLTEGRIVHFVLPNGQHRPAVVVRVFAKNAPKVGPANLRVFFDGLNDVTYAVGDGAKWEPSVPYSEEPKPGTWHWIERA